jgi:hypothetical protein
VVQGRNAPGSGGASAVARSDVNVKELKEVNDKLQNVGFLIGHDKYH